MRKYPLCFIGLIFFLIGLNLILLSWYFSYPVYMPEINNITYTQFFPAIWPGIILSLLGIFLAGYYSKSKGIKVICAAIFPIIFYVDRFFFSYIPSPDSGAVKAMFEVFHQVRIDSSVISYFQYPTYFTLNEITSQIINIKVNNIAIIFFALYGILIGIYLFLFLFKTTKNSYQIAFLAVPLYFTITFGSVSYLNYQWVPQTLALVFFLILMISFNRREIEYKLLTFIVFIALVLTHAFIPVIFLIFFGFYTLKKKELIGSFILLVLIYITVLIFYTTYYFPVIIETFKETLYNLGGEYVARISTSFKNTTIDVVDQIISMVNRIRVPLIIFVVATGFLIDFFKKKIDRILVVLGITAGLYLIVGVFFSILGLRGLQFLFIALVVGIGFFISKWKKPVLIFMIIIIMLSVFGPMRDTYNQTQFLTNQEEKTCVFLATTIPNDKTEVAAIGQVNWGYFTITNKYLKGYLQNAKRPGNPQFNIVFDKIGENDYILFNSNLAREMIDQGIKMDEIQNLILVNNKIYMCGNTYILKGNK